MHSAFFPGACFLFTLFVKSVHFRTSRSAITIHATASSVTNLVKRVMETATSAF
jgi:hypothetical protein